MERYEIILTTPFTHYQLVPLRLMSKSKHLTLEEAVHLAVSITGHGKDAIAGKLRALTHPTAFTTIERPGMTVTITRKENT
jgi:hypothetical protein